MKIFIYITIALYAAGFIVLTLRRGGETGSTDRIYVTALVAGIVSHTFWLAVRIYATGHAPMATMFETIIFYSWTVTVVTAIVVFRYKVCAPGLITLPIAVLALVFALPRYAPGGPLMLILRTHWFETHVTTSFAGYALFTLSFAAAVVNLIKARQGAVEAVRRGYGEIAARSVLWGFFFFSASMFAGAIWGYLAWGSYWMWEPKVIWSFIVWFFYAGVMHAYYVRQWRGTFVTAATVAGFFVVIFTYLGVSMLMRSSHSF